MKPGTRFYKPIGTGNSLVGGELARKFSARNYRLQIPRQYVTARAKFDETHSDCKNHPAIGTLACQ